MLKNISDTYICGLIDLLLMKFLSFKRKSILHLALILVLMQLFSCKPTRWLEQDEHLLQRNRIEVDNSTINTKELASYFRQEPNKRFLLIFKFHLAAYNFSKIGKERKWKKWIERVIGEEPSIYDSVLVERTKDQFVKFLKNEAFYNAQVEYDININHRRAWVNYYIKTLNPLLINNITYEIEDANLKPIVFSDTIHSFLTIGERMTVKALESERKRIVTQIRDSGYFEFNPEFIRYKVDTVNSRANLTLLLKQGIKSDSLNNVVEIPHKKYWINKVYFLPDFDPQKAIRNRNEYFKTFDTTYYQGFGFVFPDKPNIKPKVILKANTITQGEIYNFTKVNGTTKYLNSLRLFRLNNLNFYPELNNDSLINCVVQLTPSVYQNYSVNFETTTTQGNLGIGGYVNYQHKNLLKGAEIFNVKVSGSLQRQSETESTPAFNIVEYGAEMSLETPSFILPFRMERFYKKFNPKTSFSVSYNFQQRPDYKRSIYNANMGYDWKGSKTIRHFVSPIDISSVDVEIFDEQFLDSIEGTYLENSYKDYLIAGGNYTMFYQNKAKSAYKSFSYYRWNIGAAGNLLHFLHENLQIRDTVDGGYYAMFNLQYAQYILTDIDYRYNYFINTDNSLITRVFAGVAYPYGNATAIPFVKQFYAGGAQGIRAWHPKDLGPGSYSIPDSLNSYPNQTSDIKLEFNFEYRYSLNRNWKGALFIDVGNIWSIVKDDDREGSTFKLNQFYKQLAVGTGFGVRYDLDFAVFRVDWGIKVRDPALVGRESWVLFDGPFDIGDDIIWHFAVGYPF